MYSRLFRFALLYKVFVKLQKLDQSFKVICFYLIEYSAFSASKAMQHLIEIRDRNTIPYSFDLSKEIFIVHVPIDSFWHYPAFYTVG